MRITTLLLAGALALGGAAPVLAEDSVYVPLLTYRTGPFAGSGIPVADGMHDYLDMLNERDGGLCGVRLNVEECETGYDTQKGVECYEATKTKHPLVYNPWSTGITLALIPKAAVDHIPSLSMPYGLSAAARRPPPHPLHALRPVGRRRRPRLPLGLQPAGHLLGRALGGGEAHRRPGGRAGQAQGQEDRLHLPRRRLR